MEEQNTQDTNIVEQSTDTTDNVNIETTENQVVESNSPKFEAPVNVEALNKQKQEFGLLQEQINDISSKLSNDNDFRALRKKLVTIKEQVLTLFLIPIVDKDNLTNQIQSIYEKLAEKQDEYKEELNKIFEENLKEIEPKINNSISEALQLIIFKDARNLLTNVQNELKNSKLRQSDKDNFFKMIQDAFEKINKKETDEREAYEMECSNNFLVLKPKIEQVLQLVENSDKFNDSRKKLIDLQNEIKETKLKKNNRDELFQLIRDTFNNLNQRQDSQREVFSKESTENYNNILPKVNQALEFAVNPTNFATARQTLISLQKELKDLVLSKSQRDELFGRIREVFNGLNDMQDENREEFEAEANTNFAKIEIKVNEALMNVEYSYDFKDIREGLLTVQDEAKILKLKRNQRNELMAKIREGFEKFDKKRNEYLNNKKEEKRKKLNSILENLNQKLVRLNEQISEEEKAIEGQENSEDLKRKLTEKQEIVKSTELRISDLQKELEALN